ncbi:MAG: MFS transporter [Thermoleophilia bacterium]|nr:MFS transporter [Thermoleophilia bacterium]
MERDRGGAFESAPSTLSTLPFHWGWAVLVMGALVTFGSLGLGRFGYTMVLPSMQKGLELDNAQAGALATTGLVGYMVLAVGGGLLASRYGPRIVISVGLLATGAGMLLTAAAGGFLSAAVFQLVTGMGTGASNVPVMGLLAAWFSARRRGLASGIAVSGISVGLIVVGALAPRIVAAYDPDGWRAAWLVLGAMSTALAVLSFLLLRNRPADIGLEPLGSVKRLEPVGSVKPGMPDPGGEASAQVRTRGAASAVAKPGGRLAWGAVYRAPAVWHLGLVYVAFGFSYVIYTTFFTKHLISEGGYTQAQAGTLFMVMGWASLACGVIWGSISGQDRAKAGPGRCLRPSRRQLRSVRALDRAAGLHDLGRSLRPHRLEHPGHHGGHVRRCARAAAGAGGPGLHHPVLRRGPDRGTVTGGSHCRRRRQLQPGLPAGRRGGRPGGGGVADDPGRVDGREALGAPTGPSPARLAGARSTV